MYFYPMPANAVFLAVILTVAASGWCESQTSASKSTTPTATTTTTSRLPDNIPGVILRRDVTYLEPHREEKLDIYLPDDRPTTGLSPAVVMIHGGGWVGGGKDFRREIQTGTVLAHAGYVAVSVEYMKEEGNRWPTNLYDCKNAVRWIRKNAAELQVDPDRIGVIGGSAGGHLALMVALTSGIEPLEPSAPYPGISSHVSACVNLYGITDVARRQGTEADGTPNGVFRTRAALFSGTVEEVPEKYKLASPVTHVTVDSPPILTLHGTADRTVDRDQATALDERMKAVGARHQLMMIEDGPHSFLLHDKRIKKDLRPVVLEFFDKHLRQPRR